MLNPATFYISFQNNINPLKVASELYIYLCHCEFMDLNVFIWFSSLQILTETQIVPSVVIEICSNWLSIL